MSIRVIFSDLHFGDQACSLNIPRVKSELRKFLFDLGQVEELILAGDILDANISTLTRAIQGNKGGSQLGFKKWLAYILKSGHFKPKKIIYVPGNHDYIIWNILATNYNFVRPLAAGIPLSGHPLTEKKFPKPFIRGAAPNNFKGEFIVIYPDHEFKLAGQEVLVTHGHYLDRTQSLFKNLKDLIIQEGGNKKEAVRKFFIMTAQYQAVANAVSYMHETRNVVDKVHKNLSSFFKFFGKLRNKKIKAQTIEAIELYLKYFRGNKSPDIFIFGHTHKADRVFSNGFSRKKTKRLIKKTFEIWNTGCFLREGLKKRAGTFIVINSSKPKRKKILIYEIDIEGNIQIMKQFSGKARII